MADCARKIAVMNRPLLLCTFFVLATSSTFAQSDPAAEAQEKAKQTPAATPQQLNDQKEAAERLKSEEAFREFLNAQIKNRRLEAGDVAELDAKFLEFRLAIPRFREA